VKPLAAVALGCLLFLLGLEAALQVATLFTTARSGAWRPGAQVRILCVGDSNTYGAGVPEEASYPAQLQVLLEEASPGRYSVINLGTPGMATWQVRERLPAQLARYVPDIVILLAGVNNGWNRRPAELDSGLRTRLEALALRSHLYRLLRVALRDRSLERVDVATRADGRHQVTVGEGCPEGDCKASWRLEHDGVVEIVTHRSTAERDRDEQERTTFEDIEAMHRLLSRAGIGFVLVQYPSRVHPFDYTNRTMTRARDELGIPMAESWRALERVPMQDRVWVRATHPGEAIYAEMAREVLPIVERLAL